jgi:hypothetical protein
MAIYNRIPFLGVYLKSNERIDKFSAEEQAKLHADYNTHLGLGKDVTFNPDALEKFSESKIKNFEGFNETKDHNGRLISKSYKGEGNSDNLNAYKTGLEAALGQTKEFVDAQVDYKESVAELKKLANKVGHGTGTYKAQDLIGVMGKINEEAITAIKKQQESEKLNLENLDLEPLRKILKLQPPADNELKAIRSNLVKDLESAHSKQLAEFEKTTSSSLTTLHNAAAKDMTQLLFIANLHKNKVQTAKNIADLSEQNRKDAGIAPVVMLDGSNEISLTGITVADLDTITSITGKQIINEGNGKFKLNQASTASILNLWDFFYHQDWKQNSKADILLMAQAVRASGYEYITLDVSSFSSKEVGDEKAREAYEAARLAGYPADKITIKQNGKEIKMGELFQNYQGTKDSIDKKANDIAKKVEELTKSESAATPAGMDKIKADILATRNEIKEAEKQKLEAEKEADQINTAGAQLQNYDENDPNSPPPNFPNFS